jgi:hypothetical protein
MHLRKHVLAAGIMSILLAGWLVAASAQTEGQDARQDTEQAIDTRQGTQQRQDEWSDEKSDLVRRFRSATASVQWLRGRKAEETAQAQALDDRVAELERRLEAV